MTWVGENRESRAEESHVKENYANMRKVLSPVEGKDGKTYWKSMGVGFVGKGNTLNIHLDGLPVNGKLHVREWDEPPAAGFRSRAGFGGAAAPPAEEASSAVTEELPF